MWKWTKNKKNHDDHSEDNNYNKIIHVDLDTVKTAVRSFADKAPKGVTTRVLVKDDHSIDFDLLKPYIKGIPDKPFYMSKETYEVFEEDRKDFPVYIDTIQQAVDRYVEMYNKVPTIPDDPYHKVSYIMLQNSLLITERPPIDFFITDDEYLITYKKPK